MFSFLLGILGLGYWGIRCSDEKRAGKIQEEYRLKYTTRRKELSKLVASSNERLEIKRIVEDGEHFEEICDKLQNEFSFIFGNDFREKIALPPHIERFPEEKELFWIRGLAESLLLAQRGKISDLTILDGLLNYIHARHICVCGISGYQFSLRKFQCLEKLLCQNSSLKITFVPDAEYGRVNPDGTIPEQRLKYSDIYDSKDVWVGCKIKDRELCSNPGKRLWNDWETPAE